MQYYRLGNVKILFKRKKLCDDFADDRRCAKRFGTEMARKIRLRLDALYAAENLATFWPPNSGPERCHQLQGQLADSFSMDLVHPYRLLFRESEEESRESSEGLHGEALWRSIEVIVIEGIEDTHG